ELRVEVVHALRVGPVVPHHVRRNPLTEVGLEAAQPGIKNCGAILIESEFLALRASVPLWAKFRRNLDRFMR
ncbi:hypothetical protein ACFV90_40865, partial [Streptomyces sp. NPDC059904]|uniref:hypothetical protein n=1 Tax=Streptomyces sp. NPDC059904 TaxID=3346996 RepID=UPI003665144D